MFLQSRHTGDFLSCDPEGNLSTAAHTLDWELFYIGADGLLHCPDNSNLESIKVHRLDGNRVALEGKTQTGNFVSVNKDASIEYRLKPNGPELWEEFKVESLVGTKRPREHIQELEQNGWTAVQAFTPTQAQQLKAAVSALEDAERGEDETTWTREDGRPMLQVRIGNPAAQSELLLQASTHPLVMGLLTKYLGGKVRCATMSSNTLLQQDGGNAMDTGLGWHVDYPYHDIEPGLWPEKPLGCQVLFCLDEFTACNGGTLFRTGTQLLGREPNYTCDTPAPSGAHRCEQLGRLPSESEWPPGFTPDPNIMQYHCCPAGTVLIAHSAWWHRQVRNMASSGGDRPRRRTALLGNYTPNHVVPKDLMAEQYQQMLNSPWRARLDQRTKKAAKNLWLGHPMRHGERRAAPQLPDL